MKLKTMLLATMLVTVASSAYAGNFNTLTNGNGTTLTSANGGLKTGANNTNADRLYIQESDFEYLTGFDDTRSAIDGGSGHVVATSFDYRAFTGSTTINTGTLTLLDWRVTNNVPLLPGVPQATIYDFVYRDSSDNSLVFGSRYMNVVANNQEVNFMFRAGFSGYTARSAWTFLTDGDLRMYESGLTSDFSFAASVAYDPDVVRQKGDFSVSEGNPWSGLFLVKTNAEYYTFGTKAIGYYQAGEEGQAVVGAYIGGFVPSSTAPVVPVPEPETYAMMLAGLGLMGLVARRRRSF